ncbi:Tetratricopeptide TPR_2 repeat-containing protein [Crinalium epipsammum PCC 9333]|uniref:Tetratricopeptide TPR_2 repeat-containing protein n=1 Tax=Crinalium epipsammum PCC 9333 TaxID=1173022 RepID=K9VXN2_9CYAN|nr:tetratricopeptide repeat protein [Crinalium epipsammum]AFZ11915.1 Tetratricopeptide TPR_2 repeat-containing protein [Crinalium epipsammum PCC 9333]
MNKLFAILGIALTVVGIAPDVYAADVPNIVIPATSIEDFYQQGMQKLELKDFSGAIASFTQALTANPNNAEAYLYRALAYQRANDYESALADFKSALRLDTSYSDPIKTVERHPEFNSVYRIFKTARIQYFTEAIEQNPDDAQAYFYRGISRKNEDNQGALADFTTVIRLQPNNAEAYLQRGLSQTYSDSEKALADINEAIRLQPDHPEAYFARGQIYVLSGNLTQALPDIEASIRLNTTNPDAYGVRSHIRHKFGDIPGAIADLAQVIRLKPDQAAGLYTNRAELYLEIKDYQAAMADFTQAIRYSSDVKDFIGGGYPSYMAYGRRAALRYQLQDYRGAIADYTQMIRVTPLGSAFDGAVNSSDILAEVYFKRAEAHIKLKDQRSAIQDYQKAITYFQQRGWMTENYKKALQQLKNLQR